MRNAFHTEADALHIATKHERELRPAPLAWAPLPAFFFAVIGLWLNNIQTPSEAPELLVALTLILTTAPFLAIAVLFFRSFMTTGAPGVLLFGCGAIFWSVSGLASLGPLLAPGAEAPNITVAIHNLIIWAASLNCLAGAALMHRSWPSIEDRRRALFAALGMALAGAAFIALTVLQGWTPVFFIQGEGATLERQFVLGSTIFAILLALSLLRHDVTLRSPFLDWFALALMLLAIGYAGLMLQTTFGGVLGWVARAAQYFGGGYMLVAAYVAIRDTRPAFVVLAPSLDPAPHRYSVAVAIVVIAAVLRLVFLHDVAGRVTFITFYPAVMLAALYGGFRAAALATAFAALLADYFWLPPVRSILNLSPSDWLTTGIFVLNCLLISWIIERMQNAQARLRKVEASRRIELKRMVAERTAELELANEEKTRHLASATATAAELQAVLDAVPAGIWIARDPSYQTVQANRLATSWMRIPEGANSSKSAPSLLTFDIFDKDGRSVPNEELPLRRAARGEEVSGYEFDWRFPDGERRFLFGNAAPFHDADGNVTGGVAAFIDITERKHAEAALRESEARLKAVLDASPDPICLKDRESRWLLANAACLAVIGKPAEACLGKTDAQLFYDSADGRAMNANDLRVMTSGVSEIVEETVCTPSGVRYYTTNKAPFQDAAGNIIGLVGVARDVTERKRAEEALCESEMRAWTLLEGIAQAFWETDAEGNVATDSPSWRAYTGQSVEEWLGYGWLNAIHPEDRERTERSWRETVAAQRQFDEEYRLRSPDGGYRWTNVRAAPLLNVDGSIQKWVGMNIDIGARKRAEEARAAAHHQLQSVIDNTTATVYALDLEARFVLANAAVADVLNTTPEHLIGKRRHEFMPKEDADWHEANDREVIAAGRALEFEEYNQLDRSITWLTTKFPLRDAQGRIYAVAGISADISKRKQAEEALRESEERERQRRQELETTLSVIPAAVFIAEDKSCARITANPAGYELLRIPEGGNVSTCAPEEERPKHFEMYSATGEFLPVDRRPMQRASATGKSIEGFEYEIRFADGDHKHLIADVAPLFDASGEVRGAIGALMDITERRHMESALRHNAETLLLAQRCANAGVWNVDLDTNTVAWSEPYYDLYGLPKSVEPSLSTWMDSIHPDDRKRVSDEYELALASRDEQHLEFRILRDGQVRWLQSEGRVICDSANRPVRITGIIWDITERKRAEAALRESEERYRGIYQHAETGIAITDLTGRFQSCNPAYAAMLGYTERELLSLDFQQLLHPADRQENVQAGVQLRAGAIPSFELFNRYIRKDGKTLWVHKRVSLLRDAAGNPTHHIVLVTDMTERKRYEEHIGLLLKEVNHRAKNMLALVQAIARQTVAADPKDFVERFGERVRALAASQDLLVKAEWKGVDLHALIRSQLAHFSDLIGARIHLDGPALFISATAAQNIGMALHELATNAGKYGALSSAAGRVDIDWRLESAENGEERFQLSWRESGGRPVTKPERSGFGTIVISSMVKMSLDADIDLDFAPSGLIWRLRCSSDRVLEAAPPESLGRA
jgi:PAS domain S-box-containing protein